MGGVGVGWTILRAETASHPAAGGGFGIGEELVSEWQMLLLSPPTTHLMPQWKCGSGPL